MSIIKIGDTEFYYELHGSGTPLVLVAGYNCDHRNWLPITAGLAEHFQVLIFDNRATGQTKDNGTSELSAELMADDTMALAEALGLKMPSIIGHSMGGTIAQCIAVRHPNKINKIGILHSTAKWRKAMLHGLNTILTMRKENTSFDLQFKATLSWVFGEKFLQNKDQVAGLRNIILDDPYPQSIVDQERQFVVLEKFDARPFLAKITAPTLIVAGVEDLLSLPYESEELARNIAGSKLVSLECAHVAMVEQPQKILAILLDFFKI